MSLFDNKKNNGFTIVSKKTDVHGGFGQGVLDLSHVSSVIIDVEENDAYIDMGAMHAKSAVERGIKFSTNKEDVPNGKPYWIVWVTIDRKEEGSYYAGVTACYMEVDREARRGYKLLVDHVNRMDAAMKRKIMVSELGEAEKAALRKLLMEHNADMWANSSEELKQGLETQA
ncbi:YwhD family protein [Brevibacillus laterosporus]|uniref:YwhD family protein n=1 Tax=Brevibacillus laterosporus TaxID=1465 RepID=UPI002655E676|nr:YwhD family protein [Brevibacillus laterosporus]MDN9009257.1 YwhD family protein [Brevibacillus laterosporus]MDO0940026.1 YwhD family protein [Brevibacillus laterosporus]